MAMFDDDTKEELRNLFAAFAMNGLIMNGNPRLAFGDDTSPGRIAKRAFEFADAMLAARDPEPTADESGDQGVEGDSGFAKDDR